MLVNRRAGGIHYDRTTPTGIYPLCNPGLLVGTRAGNLNIYYGKWSEAPNESIVTCTACKRIHNKEA